MEEEADNQNHLLDLSHLIFVAVCTISFAFAIIYALEVPPKLALILGIVPIGVVAVITICLSCTFKLHPKEFKKNLEIVARNDKYTEAVKSFLFPILLVLLYFYIQQDDGQEFLFTISPVKCDMTIHTCGSSYNRYETNKVWDGADLISQLSNDEVFIITNTISEKHQTRGVCPQTGAHCSSTNINPGRRTPKWLETTSWSLKHELTRASIWNPVTCPATFSCDEGVLYDNGIQLRSCENDRLCNVVGWCPLVKLDDFSRDATFQTDFTIFLDLKPNFPAFRSPSWTNGGQNGYSANYAHIYAKLYGYERSVTTCVYDPDDDPYCPRFRLVDIVTLSEKITDFSEAAAYGGQFTVEVDWSCRFDWGKDIFDCFPQFRFYNRETNKGKPKIFPKITSQYENNRTITYSLGIQISISHVGNGRQIQVMNVLLHAQFIYVSFAMIKGPLLWICRCFIALHYMISCK